MHVVFYFKSIGKCTHTIQERKAFDVADFKEAKQIAEALSYLGEHQGEITSFKYDGGTKVGSVNRARMLYMETINDA